MNDIRNIYFVRHGQTDANAGDIPQANQSKLNDIGHKQAQILASRLGQFDISAIYTSPLIRAQETAAYIADLLHKECKILDLLTERQKPSALIGLSKHEGEGKAIYQEILNHWGEQGWRHSNEENFYDLYSRVSKLIAYIETDTQGDIICVTHGYILRLIVCYLITRSQDPVHYLQALNTLRFENTGITHVMIDQAGTWRFGSINDSTHLS
jgi:broad specificity phosphatase PhoE